MTQDQKLDLLLEKIDVMNSRLEKVEKRLETVENRLEVLENRVDVLEKKVDNSYYELRKMDVTILDEVERVHNILMRHLADKKVHMA